MTSKSTQSMVNDPACDEKYMRRALQLAVQGRLTAAPNPMVGAVVVAGGRIIGEGYHIRPGEGHAEVNALASVKPADRHLLKESTIYVTLEPCAHYGRTPPCAELIIREGIPRCVVGCIDPFAQVKGRGVAMLFQAGLEVRVGVLEDECWSLNSHFIVFHSLQRPYITLKWARSADGFIDRRRTDGSAAHLSTAEDLSTATCLPTAECLSSETCLPPAPHLSPAARLSTAATQQHVHRQRSLHQAILVGHSTWTLDRPSLDVRHWFGRPPLRCVLGHCDASQMPENVLCAPTIDAMLAELHRRGIQSLLVEGGRQTLQAFIERDLWDEAWEECAAVTLGDGVPAPQMPREADAQEEIWGVSFNRWSAEHCPL